MLSLNFTIIGAFRRFGRYISASARFTAPSLGSFILLPGLWRAADFIIPFFSITSVIALSFWLKILTLPLHLFDFWAGGFLLILSLLFHNHSFYQRISYFPTLARNPLLLAQKQRNKKILRGAVLFLSGFGIMFIYTTLPALIFALFSVKIILFALFLTPFWFYWAVQMRSLAKRIN